MVVSGLKRLSHTQTGVTSHYRLGGIKLNSREICKIDSNLHGGSEVIIINYY